MKTRMFTVQLMGPDKNGRGGIKIVRRPGGKKLKWYYHGATTPAGLKKLEKNIIRGIKKYDV